MRRMAWISLLFAFAAIACNEKDDTTLTIQAQSRVNQVVTPTSSVDVSVRDGVATLSGVASSEATRARAVNAVKGIDGVRAVKDQIATEPDTTTTRTTGGTVPVPSGEVAPTSPSP